MRSISKQSYVCLDIRASQWGYTVGYSIGYSVGYMVGLHIDKGDLQQVRRIYK